MLLPKLLLAAEMPRSMLPAGDANAHACAPIERCCNAHLPNEALCRDDVLRAAGKEILYQGSEDSAKITGSRMAFASRGQASCAQTQNHGRGQRGQTGTVGFWVARTLIDCREWRYGRITLARSCSERDCGRTSTEKPLSRHWMK